MEFNNLFSILFPDLFSRPTNPKELFNLRHASLRNAIERIFGIVKRRFKLMAAAAEYNTRTQAKIPGALAALHNFISTHDPDDLAQIDKAPGDEDEEANMGNNGPLELEINADHLGGHISTAEKNRATERRDVIAQAMWVSYQKELEDRRVEEQQANRNN